MCPHQQPKRQLLQPVVVFKLLQQHWRVPCDRAIKGAGFTPIFIHNRLTVNY